VAQVLIRGLDPEVVEKLKARAKRNGRSFEAELRLGLQQLAEDDLASALDRADEIRAMLQGQVLPDSTPLIREDRER